MDASQIIAMAENAAKFRQPFENVFDDVMRLTMPGRRRFNEPAGMLNMDDIFDETGTNAVAEFVSRMQAGMFPPFSEFVKLTASNDVAPADRHAVDKDLEDIQKYAFEEIWASNFSEEISDSLYDCSLSTGNLLVEEGDGPNALSHRSIHVTDFYMDQAGGIYRINKLPANLVEATYRRGRFSASVKKQLADLKDSEIEVIEYTMSQSARGNVVTEHFVVLKNLKEQIYYRRSSGVGSAPFITFSWNAAGGEVWSRGPALNALAAIRTTNLMVELVLENAAMSIVGIYQTDNEGVVNADQISLLPGTILPKEIGTRGLEPVQTAAGNFNMRDVVLNDQRLNIRRALYNDMLADPNKTPATATEVAERMADLAYRTAAGFSRIHNQFSSRYMHRVLHILERKKLIQLPVKNGRAIKFKAVSPLAHAQNGRQLQAFVQDLQVRSMLWGPQNAMAFYDTDRLHPWLIDMAGLDKRLFASNQKVKDKLAEGAEMIKAAAAQQGGIQLGQ